MKERPILFSGPMVRAILDGRKTQTRRVIKPQPFPSVHALKFELHPFAPSTFNGTPAQGLRIAPERNTWVCEDWCGNIIGVHGDCPHGQPGDRLWLRETWADVRGMGLDEDLFPNGVAYRADCTHQDSLRCAADYGVKWKPSIHMPRWASRITLEIESVRVERVQDITDEDAKAEGVTSTCPLYGDCGGHMHEGFRDSFCHLWDSINLKRGFGWESNPWVWVITFRRVK